MVIIFSVIGAIAQIGICLASWVIFNAPDGYVRMIEKL